MSNRKLDCFFGARYYTVRTWGWVTIAINASSPSRRLSLFILARLSSTSAMDKLRLFGSSKQSLASSFYLIVLFHMTASDVGGSHWIQFIRSSAPVGCFESSFYHSLLIHGQILFGPQTITAKKIYHDNTSLIAIRQCIIVGFHWLQIIASSIGKSKINIGSWS